MNDLEHGWVLTVDRDWAEHCGADTWLEKKCPGDDCIADFVWEKNLNTELAKRLTVEDEGILKELAMRYGAYMEGVEQPA